MSVLTDLKSDEYVKKLRKAIKSGAYSINTSKFMTEIETLHASRSIRTLTRKEVISSFSNKFIDVALQNSAHRSRIVEIKMQMLRVQNDLFKHLDQLKKSLKVRYADQLKKFTTQGDRDNIVNVVLEDAFAIMNRIKHACEFADLVIEDIDQSGWTIKHLMSAVELQVGKKSAHL